MDKLKALLRLIFAKKFLLLTPDGNKTKVLSSFTASEVSHSGNAIYITRK